MSGIRRASKAAKAMERKRQLEQMRQAREGRVSRLDAMEDDGADDNMFEVVNEEEYQELVKRRREENDFVVDDNGLGYADTGEEIMMNEGAGESKRRSVLGDDDDEDDEDDGTGKKRKKKKRAVDDMQQNAILNFAKPGVSNTNASKLTVASAATVATAEDLNIDDLMGTAPKKKGRASAIPRNTGGPARFVAPNARLSKAGALRAAAKGGLRADGSEADFSMEDGSGVDMDDSPGVEVDAGAEVAPTSADNAGPTPEPVEEVKVSMLKPMKKLGSSRAGRAVEDSGLAAEPLLGGSVGDMSAAAFGASEQAVQSLDSSTIDPMWWLKTEKNDDGSDGERYLNMFWTDATEVSGNIYIFGKVPVQEPNKPLRYVSGMVQVRENMRNLFVLPKELPGEFNKDGTPARAPMGDVFAEIKNMLVPDLVPRGNGALACKPVMRKYAFEHTSVPREETQYLKVKYNAKFPALKPDMCSGSKLKSIERIFGAQQTPVELFLLKRRLMGPCWLRIRNPAALQHSHSLCAIEVGLDNPKMVGKERTVMTSPPLTTLAVSMKTVCNPQTHTNEIVAVSATVHTKMDCDGDSPESPSVLRRFTMVRQLGTSCGQGFPSQWPHDLTDTINRTCKGAVEVLPNERAMLSKFFVRIGQEDPDILASHNLFGFEFDILLKRALHHKLPLWNRLGRLKKSTPPRSILDRDVTAGRLLLDTYKTAKEFIRETTYSLTALCESQLKIKREEVDPQDVPRYFHDSNNIIRLASHCQSDSLLVLRLLMKLQIIPLSKQLTVCSGNLWARTLRGARAERIEYLLSHEFHALKYVLPEKKGFGDDKNKKAKSDDVGDDGDDNQVGGMSRKRGKAAYAGGLVLEPKKGLYDTYILLLDFNSLYPSIIQEFNLCFTTIDWPKYMDAMKAVSEPSAEMAVGDDEEAPVVSVDSAKQLPDVPSTAAKQGVLPRVIKGLVDKRKLVKDMLKKERDPAKKKQFDIRQKALKLTANSMYGCLGFTFSRFYAKPIAALVTSKGREALQRTVDIATNSLGLDVIYGDTDSVMINTNSTDLKVVKELGSKVMAKVNELYKALVLDMDGIFKSMLLLKKKKYAAVTIAEQDGEVILDTELKGLDLVRRDWCPLSKNTGKEIVTEILSGKPRDEIVEAIHERLRALASDVREGKVALEEFVVTKGLNKLPKDYPDIKGQAHLQVALKMVEAGRPVNVGDHIPYVICVQGEEGAAAPQRARHPDEVRRSQGELTLDIEWYLGNQILPPIGRLCEPIEGTSLQQLTNELGLDAAKYAPRSAGDELDTEGWGFTPKSRLEDSERFRDCDKLTCLCKSCEKDVEFSGVFSKDGTSGLKCQECGTNYFGRMHVKDCYSHISNRVTLLVNKMVSKYYNYWLKCDDPTCGRRTRQQSVRGNACTEDCHGRMVAEYSDEMLYTQLKYLETLFDVKRSCKKRDLKESDSGLSVMQVEVLQLLGKHMRDVVEWNGYNWVRPTLWTYLAGGTGASSSGTVRAVSGRSGGGVGSPADKGMSSGAGRVAMAL